MKIVMVVHIDSSAELGKADVEKIKETLVSVAELSSVVENVDASVEESD